MAVYNVLSQNGFIMVNRALAKAYGLAAAAVLGDLCTRREQHGDGFWATNEQLMDATALGLKAVRKAVGALEDAGFIETKMQGVPQKRYFHIDDDAIARFLLKPSDSPKTPDRPEGGTGARKPLEKPAEGILEAQSVKNSCGEPIQDRLIDVPEEKIMLGGFENVPFTATELDKLKAEFPGDWEQRIDAVSDWAESKGKRVRSGLATIRNWARRESSRPGTTMRGNRAKAANTAREDAEQAVAAVVDVLRFNWPAMVANCDTGWRGTWVEPEITQRDIDNAAKILGEGYTVEDMRRATAGRMVAWGNRPDSAAWLRPKTILNPDKFPGYLGSAADDCYRYSHGELPLYNDGRMLLKWQKSPRERLMDSEFTETRAECGDDTREFLKGGGFEFKGSAWVRASRNLKGGWV